MTTALPRAAACSLLAMSSVAFAQTSQSADPDAEYEKMIDGRTEKIVSSLDLDADKAAAVKAILLKHYHNLKAWDAEHGPTLKSMQASLNTATKANDAAAADKVKADMAGVRGTKTPMHEQFVRELVRVVPFTKVNAIKDAMTYGNLALRLGIMDKLDLTPEQHTEIRDMLVATRELAMDAGTADEKAKMFLETVGRISLRVLTPEQNAKLKALQKKPASKPTTMP